MANKNAVMISIQPKWCAKIASGEKTVEVRKAKPKLETPFKVYIYCTLPPREELFGHGGIYGYANELIRLQSGEIVYDYGMRLSCDPEGRPYTKDNFLCRKVIGEFVCDEIKDCREVFIEPTCLTVDEWLKYTDSYKRTVWGWHISNLVIYDKPKQITDFTVIRKIPVEYAFGTAKQRYTLERPPQSWCYVEEVSP